MSIDPGQLLPWTVAAAVVALAVRVWAGRGRRPQSARGATLVFGLAVTAIALVGGAAVIRTDAPNPENPRALGVLVWRADNPQPVRASAAQLAVSLAVEMDSCDDPVDVRVTVTPTVEFWAARAGNLADGAVVGIAIPDPDIDTVTAALTTDAAEGLTQPGVDLPDQAPVSAQPVEHPPGSRMTVAKVSIANWGDTNYPVSFQFKADWIVADTWLGRCYVELPALVGLPSVLSAAEIAGRANDVGGPLLGPMNDIVVTSADRQAGYESRYESTRGVSSIALSGMSLDQEASLPAPDANLNGTHAWSCSSQAIDDIRFIDSLKPEDDQPDLGIPRDHNTGAYSLSAARMAEVLGRPTCATLAALEESSRGPRRDLALIAIGAVFSLGIERLVAAFHSVPKTPKEPNALTSRARGTLRRPRRRP